LGYSDPPGWGFSAGPTILPSKKDLVQDSHNKPRTRVHGKMIGNWKTELLCGTWNVRSLHKPGAALDMVKELEKYGMKCVALQEIRWEDAGTTKMSQTTIFNGECERVIDLEPVLRYTNLLYIK